MTLTPGQRFTALERFETPEGMPRSIYMEGHTYGVTEQNADLVAAAIDAGKARLGEPARQDGVRLGAASATMSGQAKVNP